MSIYQLPLGQYGYTGHVIDPPQYVISFAHSLPRLPSELDVMVVRKEKQQTHHDFRVHRISITINFLLFCLFVCLFAFAIALQYSYKCQQNIPLLIQPKLLAQARPTLCIAYPLVIIARSLRTQGAW